jgi:hypothetical protein
MRDQYVSAALDRLTDLVDAGVTLPTAHDSVVANFELTAHEAHILLARYDTMLYNLDKVIMRRARVQRGPSGHLIAAV